MSAALPPLAPPSAETLASLQQRLDLLERRIAREVAARKQAEQLLEQKSLELFERNQQLARESEERQRAQEQAARADLISGLEARFRQVVEAAPNAILMVSADGAITLVNAQTEKLFGYDRSELIGQKVEMLVPATVRARHPNLRGHYFTNRLPRAMGTGQDLFGVTKSGTEVPIEIGLNPVETPDGRFVLASIIDITERKKAEQRFRMIVEAAPSAMLMVNRQGVISLVNAQAERLFGYSRSELIGQAVELLVPQRIRGHHPGLRDGFFANPNVRSMGVGRDLFGVTKTGVEVPIEIGLNPIETPDGLFVVASIIDITERKKAELASQKFNHDMAAQMAETQSALARLTETQNQLVQAEKFASLGGLVAGIAHEINTPVGITVTAASHLQDGLTELSSKLETQALKRSDLQEFIRDSLEATRILLSNSSRAADLIHSFKMIAVDQSSGDERYLEMQSYLNEVLLSLRPNLRRSAVEIDVDCPPGIWLQTSPGGLSQIITNLVNNALLHAFEPQQSGGIFIRVRKLPANRLELRFRDDGKGMSSDIQTKIFDPFFTTKRGSGGSGLGLHIVYNLVEKTLGGQISVQSSLGAGAEFVICFPIRDSHGQSVAGATP